MRHLALALLAALVPARIAAQTTWHVDGAGCDGSGTGSEAEPFCTLGEALAVAASGDTVLVAPGTYVESLECTIPGLTIRALGGPGLTELQPDDPTAPSFTLGVMPGAELTLEGFSFGLRGIRCDQALLKLRDCHFEGVSNYTGGSLWATGSEVVLESCRFADSHSGIIGGCVFASQSALRVQGCTFLGAPPIGFPPYAGGGLYLLDCASDVADSTFAGFSAFEHGSAAYVDGGSLALEGCSFQDNLVGEYSGTLAVIDADLELRACVFRDNRSSNGWGGAVYVAAGPGNDVRLRDCVFERNSGAEGGAVCVRRGFARLERCAFLANRAGTSVFYERGHGGGLFVGGFPMDPPGGAFASVERCLFVGNQADGHSFLYAGRGGGVFGPVAVTSSTFFRNSVRAYGVPEEPTGGAAAGGATLESSIVWGHYPDGLEAGTPASWSLVEGGWPGVGNLSLDPRFVRREAGDLRLLPASPCVDAGDPTLTDPDGTRLDMGAFPLERRELSLGRRPRAKPPS